MRGISIRLTATGEWVLVADLLKQTGLDTSDVDLVRTPLHVAVAAKVIAGCAGAERHGDTAVVGPVAVLPDYRERGIASHLVQAALMRAQADGCRLAVVLPTFCAAFFCRHGFSLTPRSALPDEVRASKVYQRHDSQARHCMTRDLTRGWTGWVPPTSY